MLFPVLFCIKACNEEKQGLYSCLALNIFTFKVLLVLVLLKLEYTFPKTWGGGPGYSSPVLSWLGGRGYPSPVLPGTGWGTLCLGLGGVPQSSPVLAGGTPSWATSCLGLENSHLGDLRLGYLPPGTGELLPGTGVPLPTWDWDSLSPGLEYPSPLGTGIPLPNWD